MLDADALSFFPVRSAGTQVRTYTTLSKDWQQGKNVVTFMPAVKLEVDLIPILNPHIQPPKALNLQTPNPKSLALNLRGTCSVSRVLCTCLVVREQVCPVISELVLGVVFVGFVLGE